MYKNREKTSGNFSFVLMMPVYGGIMKKSGKKCKLFQKES